MAGPKDFKLTIDLSGVEDGESLFHAVAAQLKLTAQKLTRENLYDGVVRDYNGRQVGEFHLRNGMMMFKDEYHEYLTKELGLTVELSDITGNFGNFVIDGMPADDWVEHMMQD